MNTETIVRLLKNSGFNVLSFDSANIYIEDPSCILRSFQTFIEYAWIFVALVTAFMLFGWAISMIRGAKNNIFINLRNLIFIFAALSLVGPILNMIYGADLFGRGCKKIAVPLNEVQEILGVRQTKISKQPELYEEIEISDSGPMNTDLTNEHLSSNTDNNPILDNATSKRFVNAIASGKDVIYITSDNHRLRRTGGSRAWRNTNPGNIRNSQFASANGAIGVAGGFAVFPDESNGMNAIRQLLTSDSYRNLTVAKAISKYAPPSENNTSAYHKQIENLTGLSINRRISDLSDAELSKVVNAIRTIEGWNIGRELPE